MSLPTDYQTYIHLSRYARWDDSLGRRETWSETVARYIRFFRGRYGDVLPDEQWLTLYKAIHALEVMPSMRCLMTAGPALERDHVAGFNCSYVAIDTVVAFDEVLYVLLCGTGVGYSVERQFINRLPAVADPHYDDPTLVDFQAGQLRTLYRDEAAFPNVPRDEIATLSGSVIQVPDSKIGWASALRILLVELYCGNQAIQWDVSRVRPAGTPLKVFGGRSSGPGPLVDLFQFTKALFGRAKGRKLTSIEVHDLVCKIADIVVVGGVRRAALLSLSNRSDDRMRVAKSGQWGDTEPQRALANNSIAYTERPAVGAFMAEWQALYESKSGERGIFNREAAQKLAAKTGRRDPNQDYGTNPCSEILLLSKQFCNLSEIVVRPTDSFATLARKARIATILGTLQAGLTDFRYLRPIWRAHTEEEALLGVSLTGIMDHPVLAGTTAPYHYAGFEQFVSLGEVLEALKGVTLAVNAEYAQRFGINPSTSITCVKPSGTVSQLVDSASGIHPRYSPFYIRTIRADKKDPLARLMRALGFPVEDCVMKPTTTDIFAFPMAAPAHAVFRDERTALEQLEHWLTYQQHWAEHKPSVTIYVKDHEWPAVGAWVWEHFDRLSGVSFLPHSDHTYRQAPYQEIDEVTYTRLAAALPTAVDWSLIRRYEQEDRTTGSQELACVAGACEL